MVRCEGGMRGTINVAVQEVGNVNATWPGQRTASL